MTNTTDTEPDELLEQQAAAEGYGTPTSNGRTTQPLPHDPDAERALLGAMLLTTSAVDDATATGLTADHYYRPAHARIHDTIINLHRRGQTPDPVLVAAELGDQLDAAGGPGELLSLIAGVPSTRNAAHYARLVIRAAQLRDIIAAATEATSAARQGDLDAAHSHLQQAAVAPTVDHHDRTRRGGEWLLDQPDTTPAIWGQDDQILWAQGEPLMIVAPPGVGKTTLAGQIVAARLSLQPDVLGWPIQPGRRLLYLACDRPRQIARSLHRTFRHANRDTLDEQLAVWEGPPPADFATHPHTLCDMAKTHGADTVVIDSLKDVAVGLSDDDIGSALNRSIQTAIANQIDILILHHQRKGQGGTKPKTLEDVYGSTWITAGAGSVILLWGKAGDLIVEMEHLKQPAETVGPLKIEHDHAAGRSTIWRGLNLLELVRNAPHGYTATEVARLMYEKQTPTDNERKKAIRRLNALVDKGFLHRNERRPGGYKGGAEAAKYHAIDHHAESP